MVPIQAMEYNEENPHVQDSVKMTIQDWNVVNRRYFNPHPHHDIPCVIEYGIFGEGLQISINQKRESTVF